MIYIVGHSFIAGAPRQSKSVSITERIQMAKIHSTPAQIDSKFDQGKRYTIVAIRPIYENKKIIKYIYSFNNTSTNEIINCEFISLTEGDQFIARLSGTEEDWRSEKEQSAKAFEKMI